MNFLILKVTLSYLEIYNENIRDLLNPSSGNLELRDQDAHGKNIHVAGLSEVATNSTEEVKLLTKLLIINEIVRYITLHVMENYLNLILTKIGYAFTSKRKQRKNPRTHCS